ncbi:Histone H4, conserved site [Phytophthora cactorum]|nr:Histone H4, conserved site [Phytophthora cactorum]
MLTPLVPDRYLKSVLNVLLVRVTCYDRTWEGRGAGGAKRHRYTFKNNIEDIARASIRKLAHRAGFFRMSALVYNETRAVLNVFVGNLVQDAVVYTEHANRKTATKVDGRLYALKRQRRTFYDLKPK